MPPSRAFEDQTADHCLEDIAHLAALPETWQDLDPTAIAESLLETLLDMLDLDFAGLRFNDGGHTFLRTAFDTDLPSDGTATAIDDWLKADPTGTLAQVSIGSRKIRVLRRLLGRFASLGHLIVGARRTDFPNVGELLRLDFAAIQASLACREVRELSKRRMPPDMRQETPTGEALAARWFSFRQNPLKDAAGNIVKWYGIVSDIDGRRRAEQELKAAKSALLASERNLQLIIDSLPVLAWSARPDGSAEFINQRWLEYAGLPAERILGWGFLDLYHPDDVAGMLEIWKRDLEHSDQSFLKGRIRNREGLYRWFLFAGRKLIDANGVVRWFGCNLDIDDLHRAEAALAESEQRLKLTIDTLPAFICSATPAGDVDFYNQHFLDFVGYPFEQMEGQGFYKQFHPDDLERLIPVWQNILETKRPQSVDGRIRRADGEYRWFTLRQGPQYDANGNVVKWHVVVVDIEDRKRAEEKLRQSQSELAHATRIMTMGELAVSIAHEVNQPLMAIVTNAGTCLRWLDDTQLNLPLAREAAERVVQDGHRAGDIVASIRSLARKSAPKMEPLNINSIVQEVLDLLKGELLRRAVTCKTDFAICPTAVIADGTQLQQVVLNLIMNAADAMSQLENRRRKLVVRTLYSGTEALVAVADTGTGIDFERRDRIFEAFFSTKPQGMGMGLSICRSIIESHGGRIWAADNHPYGSVFSFTLPMSDRGGFDA